MNYKIKKVMKYGFWGAIIPTTLCILWFVIEAIRGGYPADGSLAFYVSDFQSLFYLFFYFLGGLVAGLFVGVIKIMMYSPSKNELSSSKHPQSMLEGLMMFIAIAMIIGVVIIGFMTGGDLELGGLIIGPIIAVALILIIISSILSIIRSIKNKTFF